MTLLTDDQKMLQDTARTFLAEEGTIKKQLRHWRDTGCNDGFGHALWKQFGELGLTGILFTDATSLRRQLVQLGVLGPRPNIAEPVFHLALRDELEQARTTGHYPWSTRGVTYEQQGFVHASFATQVAGIRSDTYRDVSDSDLVVLELDPRTIDVPVVVEDLGAGAAYPHLYGALPVSDAIPHGTDMLMS